MRLLTFSARSSTNLHFLFTVSISLGGTSFDDKRWPYASAADMYMGKAFLSMGIGDATGDRLESEASV